MPPGSYRDAATQGLYLKVGKRARSFSFYYKFLNRTQTMPIGRLDRGVTVALARQEAGRIRGLIEAGHDPKTNELTPGIEASGLVYFEDAWKLYKTAHLAQMKNADKEAAIIERHVMPSFEGRTVSGITRNDARNVLIQTLERAARVSNARLIRAGRPPVDNAGHYSARNVHVRMKAFFNFCIERDILERNIFEKLGMHWNTPARTRVLSLDEICEILEVLPDHRSPTFRSVMTTVIFTGMRDRSEATACRFSWVNRQQSCIEMPPGQTKNSQPYPVACPQIIMNLFDYMKELAEQDGEEAGDRFVFSTDGISEYTIPANDRAELSDLLDPEFQHFTIHDLRRSLATGLASMGVAENVVERGILHHLPEGNSDLRRVYQRYDFLEESVDALEKWVLKVEAHLKHRAQQKNIELIIDKEVSEAEKWAENNPDEYARIVRQNEQWGKNLKRRADSTLIQMFGRGHRKPREKAISK